MADDLYAILDVSPDASAEEIKERFVHREVGRSRLFLDSLLVIRNTFLAAADFVEFMSDKMRKVTSEVLRTGRVFGEISLSPSAKKALDNLEAKTSSGRDTHVTTPDPEAG